MNRILPLLILLLGFLTASAQDKFPIGKLTKEVIGNRVDINNKCNIIESVSLFGRTSFEVIDYSECLNSFEINFVGAFLYVNINDFDDPLSITHSLKSITQLGKEERRLQILKELIEESEKSHKEDSLAKIQLLVKYEKLGLMIVEDGPYDESEHTKGTGYTASVLNTSKKAIKYIWFYVLGINAVGDPVVERTKGTSLMTLRGIGPIESMESGEYDFEYVWFTDLVETTKLKSVKVQYMDGTIRTHSNPESLRLTRKERGLLDL